MTKLQQMTEEARPTERTTDFGGILISVLGFIVGLAPQIDVIKAALLSMGASDAVLSFFSGLILFCTVVYSAITKPKA